MRLGREPAPGGRRAGLTPVTLSVACAVVGVLAAVGTFNSAMNFPLVFALVCLVLGSVSVWRERARGSARARTILLVAGVSIAVAGWAYSGYAVKQRLAALQAQALEKLGGRPAPVLTGLEPLGTDRATLDAAAAFSSRATIIAFWATWCSPCWAELAELDALYREHRERGLTVLALTAYDSPGDEIRRERNRAGALEFLRRRGHSFPAAITASAGLYRAYDVRSIPSTALVDGGGTLVAYAVGLDGARALMARAEAMVTGQGRGASAGGARAP